MTTAHNSSNGIVHPECAAHEGPRYFCTCNRLWLNWSGDRDDLIDNILAYTVAERRTKVRYIHTVSIDGVDTVVPELDESSSNDLDGFFKQSEFLRQFLS